MRDANDFFGGRVFASTRGRSDLFGAGDGRALPDVQHRPATRWAVRMRGWWSFMLPIICAWADTSRCWAGSGFRFAAAGCNESATYPHLGRRWRFRGCIWVLRGFYGHSFQPAPIQTVSSSVLNYAGSLGGGRTLLRRCLRNATRSTSSGLQIPYRGWMLDVDTFKSRVNNFLDHCESWRVEYVLSRSRWMGR